MSAQQMFCLWYRFVLPDQPEMDRRCKFPQNSRARAGLAMLYQETDRADLADAAIADLLRTTPTPDAYALAARLYTMFGDASHANAIRAEARRTFAEPARPGGRPARH